MTLMLSWLQAVLITLIVLLIITQTVSIRIRYDKSFIFDIDFTLVSFSLTPNEKKKTKKRENARPGIRSIVKIVDYALSKSQLKIVAIPRLTPDNDSPLIYGYGEIFFHIALSYFHKKAISVSYSEAEQSPYLFDVAFKISFYHLVCTVVLYFKACRKSRQKARARI